MTTSNSNKKPSTNGSASNGAGPTRPAGFDWSTLKGGEAATSYIPESLARLHVAFPARVEDGRLVVVMPNTADYEAIRALEARSRMEVLPVNGDPKDILNAINVHYGTTMPDAVVEAIDEKYQARRSDRAHGVASIREIPFVMESEDQEKGADPSSPVIKAVDSLMSQAAKSRATDIHIEPLEDRVRVRFRIDGFLQEVARLPLAAHGALLSRIKVVAGMDIAERRRPQDGHFAVRVGDSALDVRAATTDTVHGEMAVLRILNKSLKLFSLDDLGLLDESTRRIRKLLGAPYGIMLVAGPTGAGKTTTLYASLNEIDRDQLNIITIEDPVEYRFDGINSMQINDKAGLTFGGSLRAVLRLDPDVILVGEIRDAETARIAVQAALTGHLVLSSVHANDSVKAVSRMVDLGVEPFLLSSALLGVVAQRMVRKICDHCTVSYQPSEDERVALQEAGMDLGDLLYKGEGCYFCSFTGYHGRTGLFEVLAASDRFKTLIMRAAGDDELLQAAVESGLTTMKQDGARKSQEGLTTPFEVMRSVYTL